MSDKAIPGGLDGPPLAQGDTEGYREIRKCRICGNERLVPLLDLGVQELTGVFPKSTDEVVTSGPLELVKCAEDTESESCGLVQLAHTYDPNELYGENYGYRSGLNPSMVSHLQRMARAILDHVSLEPGSLIIDIGSNDGTLLASYPPGATLVGIDPAGEKFKSYYPENVELMPEFFSATLVRDAFGPKRAKIVTTIAMFYDLEDPLEFMRQVRDILADDGVWVFEQSYMPKMLDVNAYDTICHEHLEYYRLKQIAWMAREAGLRIVDVKFNNVNGGSFCVTARRDESPGAHDLSVRDLLSKEHAVGLDTLKPYQEFGRRVLRLREELRAFLQKTRQAGETVVGYGASTKGNVVLQFCGLTAEDIPYIAEVNEDKFGRYTPGTRIPIVPEEDAREKNPDYMLVMPWHFREFIIEKEKDYLESGGKLVFPLPELEIVSR